MQLSDWLGLSHMTSMELGVESVLQLLLWVERRGKSMLKTE